MKRIDDNTMHLGVVNYFSETDGKTYPFNVYSMGPGQDNFYGGLSEVLSGRGFNLFFLLSGWPYNTVHGNKVFSSNHHIKSLFVEIEPGHTDFVSSRDTLDFTPRTRGFIEDIEASLNLLWAKQIINDMTVDEQFALFAYYIKEYRFSYDIHDSVKKNRLVAAFDKLGHLFQDESEGIWAKMAVVYYQKTTSSPYYYRYLKDGYYYLAYQDPTTSMKSLLSCVAPQKFNLYSIVSALRDERRIYVFSGIDGFEAEEKVIMNLKYLRGQIEGLTKSLILIVGETEDKFWEKNNQYAFLKNNITFLSYEEILKIVKEKNQRSGQHAQGGGKQSSKPVDVDFKVSIKEISVGELNYFTVEHKVIHLDDIWNGVVPTSIKINKEDIIILSTFGDSVENIARKSIHALVEKYGFAEIKKRKVYIATVRTYGVRAFLSAYKGLGQIFPGTEVCIAPSRNSLFQSPLMKKVKDRILPEAWLLYSQINENNRELAEMILRVMPALSGKYNSKELLKQLKYFNLFDSDALQNKTADELLGYYEKDYLYVGWSDLTDKIGEPLPITTDRINVVHALAGHYELFTADTPEEEKRDLAKLITSYSKVRYKPKEA